MARRRACALTAVAIGCMIAAGCGRNVTRAIPDSDPLDSLPGSFFDGLRPAMAALGEDLVLVEDIPGDGTSTASVAPSGEVRMLPDAPATAGPALGASGGSVALVGVSCFDCDAPALVAFMLSQNRERWIRLDTPPIELPRSSLVEFVGATDRLAVFETSAGVVTVSGAGVVERLPVVPDARTEYSWLCVAPGREKLYRVGSRAGGDDGGVPGPDIGSIRYGTPTVTSLDLAGTAPGWVDEPAPPAPSSVASLHALCSSDHLLVIADGSEYEFTGELWNANPDVAALADVSIAGPGASSAIAPDGSLLAIFGMYGRVLQRSSGGAWTDTGAEGSTAAAAASGVFIADALFNRVRFVTDG